MKMMRLERTRSARLTSAEQSTAEESVTSGQQRRGASTEWGIASVGKTQIDSSKTRTVLVRTDDAGLAPES